MLTVDFDLLDLQPGQLILDLGCGAGRHAFEALRRGARVVALDYSFGEVRDVARMFGAMHEVGEIPDTTQGIGIQGDALALPFPDATFDRIITSEVMEHIRDDAAAMAEVTRVLKPGGTIAVTVPSWLPEKLCWALSAEYHAPLAEGGHVRIYTAEQLRRRMADAGLEPTAAHRAHALHSPYWWLKCAVGPTNDSHPLVRAYHQVLVWDISKAPLATRLPERLLNPVLGKSIVVYATKPQPAESASRTTGRKRRVAA